MRSAPLPKGPVLAVAPHPDDELIGCGGALAAHVARGDRVRVLVVHDGALGDPDGRFGEREDYVARRAEEARAGGAMLGLDDYVLLGLPEGHEPTDGQLEAGAARIAAEARSIGARCVYSPGPGDAHGDHRAAAQATALALARLGPFVEAWSYEVGTPVRGERLVAIDEYADAKLAAIAEHATQTAYRDLVGEARAVAARRAIGVEGCAAAEAFARLAAASERRAG